MDPHAIEVAFHHDHRFAACRRRILQIEQLAPFLKSRREFVFGPCAIHRPPGITNDLTVGIRDRNHDPAPHQTWPAVVAHSELGGCDPVNAARLQVPMILIDARQHESQRSIRHFFFPNQFLLRRRHRSGRGHSEPPLQPACRFANRALLHRRHEIQYVTLRLAGEAVKCILAQAGPEGVFALAAMDRTTAFQAVPKPAQTGHPIVAQHRLQAHGLLDCPELHPLTHGVDPHENRPMPDSGYPHWSVAAGSCRTADSDRCPPAPPSPPRNPSSTASSLSPSLALLQPPTPKIHYCAV